TNSQLSDNNDGIVMGDSAQATITNSQLSGNGDNGIYTGGSAQAKIRDSTIESNGTNKYCKRKDHICNGIQVGKKSQVKIIDSKIIKNADWGVGAELKQCGSWDDFTGQVAFEDMMLEDISGNNTTGKKKGMGNPGNHYWNRPDILDGQVCLP
ncbi:right-handed parallel beta-helix repeat-containing protein, partial [Candidatus Acetothermia bacterium]|nr:right-handed parallel beta-helix repeat-containing protein [Candidatus Acetothermia bacterium]